MPPGNFEISDPFSCNLKHTVGHFLTSDNTILIFAISGIETFQVSQETFHTS